MDNYNLSNLPLSGDCANSGEHDPWLTDEENRRATFSGRSTTVSTPEQAELQQPSLSYEEQLSEQKTLTDFDISLLPSFHDRAIFDEPDDPFALLAAYRPLTLDDRSQHPSVIELGLGSGFLEGFTAEDLTDLAAEDLSDVVLAELEGDDVLKLPEQFQGESDTAGIIIPQSTNPDTDTDKRSGKRRAPESRNLVIGNLPESVIKESSRRSGSLDSGIPLNLIQPDIIGPSYSRLQQPVKSPPQKRAKSDSKQAVSPPPRVIAKVKPSKRHVGSVDEWLLRTDSKEKPFMCGCPGCGRMFRSSRALRSHTFEHTGVSEHRCTYPECGPEAYFRDNKALRRHFCRVHNLLKPPNCPHCCRAFASQTMLNAHFKNDHLIVGDNIPPT